MKRWVRRLMSVCRCLASSGVRLGLSNKTWNPNVPDQSKQKRKGWQEGKDILLGKVHWHAISPKSGNWRTFIPEEVLHKVQVLGRALCSLGLTSVGFFPSRGLCRVFTLLVRVFAQRLWHIVPTGPNKHVTNSSQVKALMSWRGVAWALFAFWSVWRTRPPAAGPRRRKCRRMWCLPLCRCPPHRFLRSTCRSFGRGIRHFGAAGVGAWLLPFEFLGDACAPNSIDFESADTPPLLWYHMDLKGIGMSSGDTR